MAAPQEVAVADIVKVLLATNQQFISKVEAQQCVDLVFLQMHEADQRLHQELTKAYDNISPSPEPASQHKSAKRQRLETTTTSKAPVLPPPLFTSTNEEADEATRCVCESDLDTDSPWICCEECSVWQHMSCMRLPWTAEEAEQRKYLCEICAPEEHQEILDMLKKGTWKALAFKSTEDEMEGCEEVARIEMKKNGEESQPALLNIDTEVRLSTVAVSSQSGAKPRIEPEQLQHHPSHAGTYPPRSVFTEDIEAALIGVGPEILPPGNITGAVDNGQNDSAQHQHTQGSDNETVHDLMPPSVDPASQ